MSEDNYKIDELRCDEHKRTCYDCWKDCKVCELNLDTFYSKNMYLYDCSRFGMYYYWLSDAITFKMKEDAGE